MNWLDANKVMNIIIKGHVLIHVLILIALVVVAIRLGEIAELMKHVLYHTYNCCEFH